MIRHDEEPPPLTLGLLQGSQRRSSHHPSSPAFGPLTPPTWLRSHVDLLQLLVCEEELEKESRNTGPNTPRYLNPHRRRRRRRRQSIISLHLHQPDHSSVTTGRRSSTKHPLINPPNTAALMRQEATHTHTHTGKAEQV